MDLLRQKLNSSNMYSPKSYFFPLQSHKLQVHHTCSRHSLRSQSGKAMTYHSKETLDLRQAWECVKQIYPQQHVLLSCFGWLCKKGHLRKVTPDSKTMLCPTFPLKGTPLISFRLRYARQRKEERLENIMNTQCINLNRIKLKEKLFNIQHY